MLNNNDTETHREVPPVVAGLAAETMSTAAATAAIAPHGAPTQLPNTWRFEDEAERVAAEGIRSMLFFPCVIHIMR